MRTWAALFTNRQLTALTTFSDLVGETRARVESDAAAAGLAREDARAYANALAVYLALAQDRVSDTHCTLTRWKPSMDQSIGAFSRQALPMVWDFAEVNPFAGAAGDLDVSTATVGRVLERLRPAAAGSADQADARELPSGATVATDPPYYDNIGYADLSDFFYVWLRRSLDAVEPLLFRTIVTPKADELIATPYRHDGSSDEARRYFEAGFVDVFKSAYGSDSSPAPMTLFYAFKQSEDSEAEGIGSTGWSTMLEGLAAAGWMVTATWPMRTEMGNRMLASGKNALASSIVLACRPRPATASVTDRQGLVRALQGELPEPLHELQKAYIAPVDLRQAAIGPGMAVFSRFAKVIEPNGDTMKVRTALGLINEALDQVLDQQEQEFDAETRWAIHWFSQFFFDEGPYGVAEQLAVSMNVAVGSMVDAGVLQSSGGRTRLLTRGELPDDWDPTTDLRTPVWEATQHLVKRLEAEGEMSAARLLRRLGGLGESAQLLAYRLYTLCERSRPNLAGSFNALVASWPEIQRLAREEGEPTVFPEQQTLGT